MESIKINIKDPKKINAFLDKIVIPTKGNIYIQVEEPIDAPDGSIWINPEEDPIISEGDSFSGQDIDIILTRNGPDELVVTCTGLDPEETYALHLYTITRRKGHNQKKWQHHPNYDVDDGGMNIQRKGYGCIAGRSYEYKGQQYYPLVPDWMPNNGYLQTEWSFIPDKNGVAKVVINPKHWLVPLLKPEWPSDFLDPNGNFYFIGAKRSDSHSLPFKFRVVRLSDGKMSRLSEQTFSAGLQSSRNITLINADSADAVIIQNEGLHTSISVR